MGQTSAVSTGAAAPQASRYVAFISYRHVEPDSVWARWLHSALETYRVPRRLARDRGLPARLGRVFRDEEELSASADLNARLSTALVESEFLIVVCSRKTPESRWVEEEIRQFIALGRQDRILTLLVDGAPDEAFPRPLLELRSGADSRRTEPLAADVRSQSPHRSGHARGLAKLRLISTILGVQFDDLRQRERARMRRRKLLTGVTASFAVMLAGWIAFLVVKNQRTRHEVDLQERLAGMIQTGDWKPERLREMETLTDDLMKADAQRGGQARQRVYEGLADHLSKRLREPRLAPADAESVKAGIAILSARGAVPDRVSQLSKALADRVTDWELVADLAPPFDQLPTLFDADQSVGRTADHVITGPQKAEREARVTNTTIAASARTRVELTFFPPEVDATAVGVAFGWPKWSGVRIATAHASTGDGYAAVITETGIEMRRGTGVLASLPKPEERDPTKPMRLTLTRFDQTLTMQLEGQQPVTLEDLFGTTRNPDQRVGIVGSKLKVSRVRVWRQEKVATPSSLEVGDAKFGAEDYAAALAEYRLQKATGSAATKREASLKAGICLEALAQPAEASAEYESLVNSGTDQWAALAGVRLLSMYIADHRTELAAALIENLSLRFNRTHFERCVPEYFRNPMIYGFLFGSPTGVTSHGALDILVLDAEGMRRREQAVALAKLLGSGDNNISWLTLGMAKGYDRVGRQTDAVEACRAHLAGRKLLYFHDALIAEHYLWLLRRSGKLDEATQKAQDFIGRAAPPGSPERVGLALLVEAARLEAARGNWPAAERHIERYFATPLSVHNNYESWSAACLVRGFIRLHRNDQEGAIQAWSAGVLKANRTGGADSEVRSLEKQRASIGIVNAAMLGGLTGQWGEPEGKLLMSRIAAGSSERTDTTGGMARVLSASFPSRIGYECWQTPRGKSVARQYAMRDCSFYESQTLPSAAMTTQLLRNGTHPVNDEQEAVYWETANRAVDAFASGRIKTERLVNAAAAWKGISGFLGWGALEPSLKEIPELYPYVAYVVGRRYAYLGMKKEAAAQLRAAAAAGRGTIVEKLATQELQAVTTAPSTAPATKPSPEPH